MLDNLGTRPIDRRRAATRDEIVAAAWGLSHEQGLGGWSLRELADRVGMRAPSLYSYFDSKHAIHDALFADGQRQLLELLRPFAGAGSGREHLRAGTRAYFEFCVADPVRYQLLFQRTLPGFTPSEESYALALEVLGLAEQAIRSAGASEPAQLDLWTALITGLVAQQLANEPGGDRWGRLLDAAIDMFCDHVGIPSDRRTTTTTTRRTP